MAVIGIDHVELRVSDPLKTAKILVDLFGGKVKTINASLAEVHFPDGPFLELKIGNPSPVPECNRALSRLAILITDTDALLPQIRRIDPNLQEIGWSGDPPRRIVQFSVGTLLCHTIERRVAVT